DEPVRADGRLPGRARVALDRIRPAAWNMAGAVGDRDADMPHRGRAAGRATACGAPRASRDPAIESLRSRGYRRAILVEHFAAVLWVTGAFTVTPILQFIAPRPVLARLYRIELADEAGVLFARHWGLLAACFGGLLLFAAAHPELRPAVVTAALVEK